MIGIFLGALFLIIAFIMKSANDQFTPGDIVADIPPAILAVFGIVSIVAGIFSIA